MSGVLFGSSSSESSIPGWVEAPAREMLQRSIDLSKVGYQPYSGPQVAAMDPAQLASMRNTNDAAGAFGMQQAMPRVSGAQDFGNGTWGYSSLPLYQQQQEWMAQNRPGQQQFYNDHFVDPQTGQAGSRMIDTPTIEGLLTGLADEMRDFGGPGDHGYGGKRGGDGGERSGGGSERGGGGVGGYSGLGDMFDGGGPGASGDTFGGALGGVSNGLGAEPGVGLFGGWL